ncbi:MAG: hypothetical protein F6K40_07225 [Okeania sp. SIO3I5]|uniref:hypothetical protein n=1 Tax=Okeania sp. SIO3I5 TaxID=2607805 RepID=UPI0013BA01B1|nr:hypothetical protein [Okeania sp. SIO3I5]NEQ36084.1 hypothetical protein [Okeania sp. SIO3I5]
MIIFIDKYPENDVVISEFGKTQRVYKSLISGFCAMIGIRNVILGNDFSKS